MIQLYPFKDAMEVQAHMLIALSQQIYFLLVLEEISTGMQTETEFTERLRTALT